MEVHGVKIVRGGVDEKKLAPVIALMVKHKITPNSKDALSLLPQSPWYSVEFMLRKTSSSTANAFRRVLIEELSTTCLCFDDANMSTDDEFILADVLQKNIELLPISQERKGNFEEKTISLYKYNNTNDVIDVKASDITIGPKKPEKSKVPVSDDEPKAVKSTKTKTKVGKVKVKVKVKGGKSEVKLINKLIPDANITITMLRPGKYIQIDSMSFLTGYSKNDAGKFTMLDNVTYDILNVKHYDQFTHKGKRSIEYDPTEFRIGFKTSGNITPKNVIGLMTQILTDKLERAHAFVTEYAKSDQTKQLYYTDGFEVSLKDDITTYKFYGEYITLSNLLAHNCFVLDKTILFCAPAVDRLDNEVAIVRLKHADPNTLILSAIDMAMTDVNKVSKAFV